MYVLVRRGEGGGLSEVGRVSRDSVAARSPPTVHLDSAVCRVVGVVVARALS